ncbi:uncharacterized protein LOC126195080 [Schistocerca nitens]|uniref:uncharacterized protein LOC126195080 n=1 Tax=Schistocerca nitens TaxID=7011 RepID=UPI0021188952|nr:uncharacterized protein LOC126195080 [Schistocerca nitens]
MLRATLPLFLGAAFIAFGSTNAFIQHPPKEALLPDVLLREVVDRMGKDLADAADAAYIDFPDPNRMSLGALMSGRAVKDLDGEESQFPLDYEHFADLANNPSPSIRDQEYLQHSTLWGHQYVAGGSGEAPESGRPPQVKTDAALPSYCNPPNPCPVGHGAEDGCISSFENTAGFSRRFQAEQDCMCDTEHMFDCPSSSSSSGGGGGGGNRGGDQRGSRDGSDLDRFVQQFAGVEDRHPTLVAKKYHIEKDENPFLHGERLPVAAKKGNNVLY